MATIRARKKKKSQNKMAVLSIITVVCMLMLVVFVKRLELDSRNEEYVVKEEQLQSQIKDEEERTAELEEFKKYTQTKKYAEEVAKDKLGLVYDDEIIFKTEED